MAILFGSSKLYLTFFCALIVWNIKFGESFDISISKKYDLCGDSSVSYILIGRLCGAFFDKMPKQRKYILHFIYYIICIGSFNLKLQNFKRIISGLKKRKFDFLQQNENGNLKKT